MPDILLYGDIVEALAQAQGGAGRPANAAELAGAFTRLQVRDGHVGLGPGGAALFNPDGSGKRKGPTGEHIVSLRPHVQGGRVLPEATIAVWAWHGRPGRADVSPPEGEWRPVGEPLKVLYDQFPGEGGGHE